jgi:hypothetical protein
VQSGQSPEERRERECSGANGNGQESGPHDDASYGFVKPTLRIAAVPEGTQRLGRGNEKMRSQLRRFQITPQPLRGMDQLEHDWILV